MKFLCRRSSLYDYEGEEPDKKPHPEAKFEPSGVPTAYTGEDWEYHDDPEGKRWFLEVNSLTELLRLVAEHGKVVVAPRDDIKEGMLEIEIYDGYRE